MKILHVSALDMGGAATAAIRLHKGLLKAGIESSFLTKGKCNRNIPHKFIYEPKQEEVSLLKVLKKTLKVRLGLESPHSFYDAQYLTLQGEPTGVGFGFAETLDDITAHPTYREADIIHLHWVAGWLDYPSFFAKNKKPVIWTLHDLNPFSGGLHYAQGTSISENQMGHLITLPKDNLQAAHNRNLQIKRQSVAKFSRLQVVSPSDWLLRQSAQSLVFGDCPHVHIPYNLDLTTFKPYPAARDLFGLASDTKVLLFVADSVESIVKGFDLLKNALLRVQDSCNFQLLVVGLDKGNALTGLKNVHHLGYVQDELLMAMIYSAADAFILPSLMDNFPNTMLEATACGTPVIAFPIGGIPEAIRHGENGIICPAVNAESLATALEDFYAGKYAFDRAQIAAAAAGKYHDAVIVEAYLRVYRDALAKS